MIIEDDRDDNIYNQGFDYQGENVEPEYGPTTFAEFIQCIDIHRRTIPELLVMSGISSGTPNNLQ